MVPSIKSTQSHKWCYVSLIFSLFYFMPAIVQIGQLSFFEGVLILVIYCLFLAFYIVSVNVTSDKAQWIVVMMLVVSTLGTSVTAGTSSLFGFAIFLSSFYVSFKKSLGFLGLALVLICAAAWVFGYFQVYFLLPAIAVTIGLFIYGRLSRNEYEHQLIKQKHNADIEQLATIAERERIARDIHDLLGHSLSSIAIKAQLAEKLLQHDKKEKALTELRSLSDITRQSLSEVRMAVTNIKQKGLLGVITQLSAQLEDSGIVVSKVATVLYVPAKIESTCIMLLKEWVTNILRHSQTKKVDFCIKQVDTTLTLSVTTDDQLESLKEGNGIQGMRERVSSHNGSLDIILNPTLTLHISFTY